ncbi:uncharacterized protein [Prorops nasuta]|uniref:uncharacterized protein isoform X2 n=1 Tax=Prorops nasuta TaxID=863751 RepID=UPI0034CDB49C
MARVCKAFVAIVVFWRVFVVTKAGDDAKATLANRSNDSNLDSVSKEFNSYRPSDMTAKAAASQMPPLTALMSPSLPSPQYLPAIQQNLPPPVNIYTTTPAPPPVQSLSHFRSENMPYGFDYFALPYPVANPITHPMAQRNPEPIIAVSPKYIVLLSFIGLLLLFAIIQNTIVATKRKGILVDNLNNRRKRELYDTIGLEDKFSMLTPEAKEVLNDDGKIRCIQRTICLENRKLVRDLGKIGGI